MNHDLYPGVTEEKHGAGDQEIYYISKHIVHLAPPMATRGSRKIYIFFLVCLSVSQSMEVLGSKQILRTASRRSK